MRLWGRLPTCGGLAIRLPPFDVAPGGKARTLPTGGLPTRRRLTIFPTKNLASSRHFHDNFHCGHHTITESGSLWGPAVTIDRSDCLPDHHHPAACGGRLAGLAGRMIHQERELAIKRAADRRHDALDQVHRELSARLEAIKLQEINRLIRAPASSPHENPAVVFTATLEGDRVVLPWEAHSEQPASESPEFARHRQDGEGARSSPNTILAPHPASAYRQALAAARTPLETAEARLLLARALAKAGDAGEAAAQYHALLHDAGETSDEQGIPFRALRRRASAPVEAGAGCRPAVPPRGVEPSAPAHLAGSLHGPGRCSIRFPRAKCRTNASASSAPHRGTRTSRRVLAKDFGRVRAQIAAGGAPSRTAPPSRPVWAAYGTEPWLVTIVPPANHPLPGVCPGGVVRQSRSADGVKLSSLTGDYLGEDFPGLHVEWPPEQFSERNSPETARQEC